MTLRFSLCSALFAVLAAVPAPAVDATMLGLVMPDAKVVAGADVDRMMQSPLGQFALSQVKTDDAQLKALLETTGFDPRKDVREVLIATVGDPDAPGTLVVVRGTFNTAKLTALAGEHGGTVTSYKGFPVFTGNVFSHAKYDNGWVAILDGAMLVAGPEQDVRAALDRWVAGTAPDPEIAAKAKTLSGTYDIWGFSTVNPLALRPAAASPDAQGPAQALQSILGVSGGVKLGAIIEITAEATAATEQDAASLSGVASFLAQMAAQQQQAANPLGLFLKSLQASADGKVARITISAPEADMERLINSRLPVAQVVSPLPGQ